MSLKFFHLFFIGSAALMCVVCAVLIALFAGSEPWALPSIVAASISAAALVYYGRVFVRKVGAFLPER